MVKKEQSEVSKPAVIITVTKIIKKLSVREKKAEIGILVVFYFLANIQRVVCGI